jgi:class 3 adenylate cyclase
MSTSGSSQTATGIQDRRKLVAVLYADMVGYSRLIGLDNQGTIQRLRGLRQKLIDPAIEKHGGRIVQTGGDSLLVVFDSIDGAVRCAVQVQEQVPIHDGGVADQAIRFRIGIDIGDAIPDGTDLHGGAVNVAARLQSECPPGGVCVSRPVRDHAQGRLNRAFDELGPIKLKNIAEPVEAFALRFDSETGGQATAPASANTIRTPSNSPRLSVVVLPFRNLSGVISDEYLADAITDDLTRDISRLPGAFVIATESAYAYKNKTSNLPAICAELGVRYAVAGSVRRLGDIVRVNARLVSADTGAQIWVDRFDQPMSDLVGQDDISHQIALALGVAVVGAESARSIQERPVNPNALDLILRPRSLQNQQTILDRIDEIQELFERALLIDPTSVAAMTGVIGALFVHWTDRGYWPDADTQKRAKDILLTAQAKAPADEEVLVAQARLLESEGRFNEMMAVAEQIIDLYPSSVYGYLRLARGKIFAGNANEAIPLLKKTIQLNPRDAYLWDRYWRIGYALLLVGRYEESIVWHQRALAVYPDAPPELRARRYYMMAAAYALSHQLGDAPNHRPQCRDCKDLTARKVAGGRKASHH